MSFGISGDYKRVEESHYPGRIREAALSEERADDQRHLAELEELVKKQQRKGGQAEDVVELHEEAQKRPQEDDPPQEPAAAKDPEGPEGEDGPKHLDITV